jgi:formylglycine-generating enzyme required for sulfatase activity
MSGGVARVWTYCGVVATVAVATACSSQPAPAAGLEVRIETDLQSPREYNAFRVEVSHQVGAGWKSLLNNVYEVPTEAALPTRLAIEPGASGDQDSLIQVTALDGYQGMNTGKPVVVRVAQIQVPTTRVAELTLELSRTCIGVKCSASESCQPSGGATPGKCEPRIINPTLLPTYESGDAGDVDGTLGGDDGGGRAQDGGKDSATAGPDSTTPPGMDGATGPEGGMDAFGGMDATGMEAGSSTPPSCVPVGSGTSECGSSRESCCTSLEVTGGTPYYRTYNTAESLTGPPAGGWTDEADPATVSSFRLDKYLVTVGRFRQFVSAWKGGYASTPASSPPSGSGKHTHLNGGQGLANVGGAGGYESGWDATDWNNTVDVEPTTENLQCQSPYNTWTDLAGSNENLPINCVTWYESYAFCIWDGGFLPTEAEWEYAAAGGSQQLEYPWGSTAPGTMNQYAIYDIHYTGNPTDIAPVGTASLGAGYWNQLDLAGEVWEWNLDWYATYEACTDCACANTAPVTSARVVRGGYFYFTTSCLLPPDRYNGSPELRYYNTGFRCARTP